MRARSIVLVLAAASLTLAVSLSSANADVAAPEIIIFHGEDLGRRVVLPSWDENHQFLLAADSSSVTLRELENRRAFSVALFWGFTWRAYTRDADALAKLDPVRANQEGRFYPARADADAILVLWGQRGERKVRRIRREGLDVLARRGLPVKFSE